MSSSDSYDGPGASTIQNFEGGQPSRGDLVPAIIFTVLLGLTLPLLAWRILDRNHRSRILTNSVIFFITRLVAQILRAYMSRRSYGPNILIAETVLLTIGWLFLINNLIDLWQRHVEASAWDAEHNRESFGQTGNGAGANQAFVDRKTRNVKWVKYFATFLRLLLLASLASIIAAGAILRRRLDDGQQISLIKNLVKASYLLGLIASAITLLTTLITHFTNHRSVRKTLFLVLYTIPLLISSVYRVVEAYTGYRASSRQRAAFWVALILMELIAYSILLAISIPKWFGKLKERVHRNASDAEKLNGRHSVDTTAAGRSSYAPTMNATTAQARSG